MNVDAKQFPAWFAGSRVVDARGQPLFVYHGTLETFDAFLHPNDKEGGHASSHLGIYFSDNPVVANAFAGCDSGSNVVPAILSIKRPFQMTWARFRRDFIDAADRNDWATLERAIELRCELQEAGYDGIRILGSRTSPLLEARGDQWVAFDPSQVASALAVGPALMQWMKDHTRPLRSSFYAEELIP